MEKSKFGFSSAFYPAVMLLCVLFSSVWAGLIILGFVLLAENSEKLAKQTIHAFLYFFVWQIYLLVTGQLMKLYVFSWGKIMDLISISWVYNVYNGIRGFFNGLGSLIYLLYVVLILVLGVIPLLRGKDMKLPGKKFVARLYGEITSKKAQAAAPPPPSGGQ
ncbi:MAG: hypothetical protein FWG93_00420 [Oscillospiraceae bacterium]|nr:hypothetical protein [Oscillospiraceae bacterium]